VKKAALLSIAISALFSGSALASTAHHTKVVSDCQHAHYKPTSIVLACDQTYILTKINYTKWGARIAKGSDRTFVNDCDPNCAAGKGTFRHETFILDRARTRHGVTVFTRARMYRHGKLNQTWRLSFPS